MHALEVRPDVLDWESERHNRLMQQDQRARNDEARGRLQLVDAPPAAPPWLDKLQAIPAIRSGLIPLDEANEYDVWSKPFSLVKADFEPWLSFYTGYLGSRLFLNAPKRGQDGPPELDFPIRALLDLKKVDPRLIIEPPVQIDGPVEFFDAERAPHAERGAALAQSLARASDAMHKSQLRRAVERGRDMGNLLHDALLGDGVTNLIRAWERVYQRKPSVHELHVMLTTGRTAPVQPRPAAPAAAEVNPVPPVPRSTRAAAPAAATGSALHAPGAMPRSPVAAPATTEPPKAVEAVPFAAKEPEHSLLWYLAHATGLTCAGALIYLLLA